MKKISKKYTGILMGAISGVFMSLFMSLVVTFINLGFVENFFQMWGRAFTFSLPIGFPTALIVIPIVKKIVENITE